ncbi:uncharacterized protein LOC130566097 isoform X2 [Triplophysa rosa]|uniref:uncharacterized protein LOC130566097 isoform X2 n=1 Tax=Triplophysa rosa TaxID=992332 RepID=UPI0025460427|nr:uncharacterized protein LOC130566097 isoform X2 [Triplophysa rosa]
MDNEKCSLDGFELKTDGFDFKTILRHLLDQDELVMKSSEGLPMTSMDKISLPANGQYGPFKFSNMCVVDSSLMASYCCYLKTDQVRSLFGSHKILRAVMVFMGAKMYNEAKACWLFAQMDLYESSKIIITKANNTDTQQFEVNAWSEPTDHLNIFNELVLVKYHFDEDRNSPSACIFQVLSNILSTFEHLGDVRALGMNEHKPTLILVDINRRKDTTPPLIISDCYSRIYELQFLVMTRKSFHNHVIVGLLLSEWALYDDLKTDYDDFNPKSADFKEDFIILLAGYVNIPQDEPHDVPFGIAEEGRYGTRVFNPSRNQPKEHLD